MDAGSRPDMTASGLRAIIGRHGDVVVADSKNVIRMPEEITSPVSRVIIDFLHAETLEPAGSVLYPPGGWMGWHTNSDRPGWRVYVSYVRSKDKCFFRWRDGRDVSTDYDAAGLNIRMFRVGDVSDPLWHCVYADDWRFSIGFRAW